MEVEVSGVKPSAMVIKRREKSESVVLQQCQRAFELLESNRSLEDDDYGDNENDVVGYSVAKDDDECRCREADETYHLGDEVVIGGDKNIVGDSAGTLDGPPATTRKY
ncbi:hypothetical protein L484_019348 [Morus notabilis]|uniref:Uncharacterized protein n=1 Tax=Morus notabilis TaxID=981085 RepID=W9QPD2_9ROSA|nr:hypothetical protein L484_019348 [Morus notabilis]